MSDAYSINAKIDGDSSGFTTAIEQAEKALDGLTDSVEGTEKTTGKSTLNINDGLKSWGMNLDKLYDTGSGMFNKFGIDIEAFAAKLGTNGKIVAAVVAVGAILVDIGKQLVQFGQEFDGVNETLAKGTGATGRALAGLNADFTALLRLGVEQDLSDIGQAMADLNTKFGLTGPVLVDTTKNIADFADVIDVSATEAVKTITDITNKWGLELEQTPELMDQLTVAAQNSGASAKALGDTLITGQSVLSQFGLGITDSLALLGSFEKQGIKSETVMQGLRTALAYYSRENINANEGLEATIETIKNAKNPTEALSEAVEVFGSRAGAEMVRALQSGNDELESFYAALENATGAVQRTGDASETLADKQAVLSGKLKAMFEPLGTGAVEAASSVVDVITGLVDTLDPILSPILDIIGTILSELFTTFGNVFASINRVIQKFAGVWGVVGGEVATVANLIIKIFTTLGTVISSVVDIIASILVGDWGRAWTQMQLIALTAVDLVLTAASTLVNALLVLVNGLITQMNGVVAGVMKAVSKVAGLFGKEVDATVYQIKNIGQVSFSEATGITKKIDELNAKLAEDTKTRAAGTKTSLEGTFAGIATAAEASNKKQVEDAKTTNATIETAATTAAENITDVKKTEAEKQTATEKTETAAAVIAVAKAETDKTTAVENAAKDRVDAVKTAADEEDVVIKDTATAWQEYFNSFTKGITDNAADWSDVFNSVQGAVTNIATGGLKLIGESLVTGEMDWASWGDMAMNAFAGILQALGAQLAAMAAAKLLMGDFAGAALAAAGSAAAYVASGVVSELQDTGDAAGTASTEVEKLADALGSIESVAQTVSENIFSGENAADIVAATTAYNNAAFKATNAINNYNNIRKSLGYTYTQKMNIKQDALDAIADREEAAAVLNAARAYEATVIKNAQTQIQEAIDETNASIDSYIYLFGEARTANISYLSSLQKITAGMQSFYASVANAGSEIADTLISNLTSGLDESSFLESIKEYITKMVIQAAVYTDSLTSKLAEIGAAIGKGIASGFSAADLTELRKELATLYQDASKAASAATAIIGSAFDVPAYANGTDYARGGLALVGEQGAELVNLPRGASVTPARQTAEILGSGSKTVTNNYTFNSPTTLNAADMVTKIKSTQRSLAVAMVI